MTARPTASCALALLAASAAFPAASAPLDVLLTATPERTAPTAYIEVAADRVNGKLKFLNSRDDNPLLVPTEGDYNGVHVAAGARVAEGLWLSGRLWQRHISDAADTYRYRSWQASGQYRFLDESGARPAMAVRLSAWGNSAKATETSTPVYVPGAILNTVTVSKPSDRSLQADLVGTWALSSAVDLSAVLSVGSTRLAYGSLAATTTRNGCNYQLSFTGNDIFGELASPCNNGGAVIRQFYDNSGSYGVDVANEIAWRGRFMQLGVNAAWRDGPWTLLGGYLFHAVKRQSVDDILASRGDPVHKRNHIVALEADYRFQPNVSVFARTEISSNLFFNDVPVTYNSSTSGRFGSGFSSITLGLRAGF